MQSVQSVVDIATAASATTLGAPTAANFFRDSLQASIKVTVQLTQAQRLEVEREAGTPLVFLQRDPVTHDHPTLAAMRQIIRHSHEHTARVASTSLRTLVVGASEREISLYDANPAVNFMLGMHEGKDTTRTLLPLLERIAKNLRAKARMTASGPANSAARRYVDLAQVISDMRTTGNLPPRYHTGYTQAQVLIFEDSAYNFTRDMFLDAFRATGATAAYGYLVLPFDLRIPHMPENAMYVYREHQEGLRTVSTMYFRGGYSNGYVHDKYAWATLLASPVINAPDMSLLVEITSRCGPLAAFKLQRTDAGGERVLRPISIPAHMHFVRVLDIMQSIDMRTCKRKRELVYFSVYSEEFYKLLNYALSLADNSMTLANLVTYIRRASGGISLVTTELVRPWQLAKDKVYGLALTTFVYANLIKEKTAEALAKLDVKGITDKFRKFMAAITWPISTWIGMVQDLIAWLLAENLTDKLILEMSGDIVQTATVTSRRIKIPTPFMPYVPPADPVIGPAGGPEVPTRPDWLDSSCDVTCEVCEKVAIKGANEGQIIKCTPGKSHVKIDVSLERRNEWHSRLIDTDGDPVGIAKVKEVAARHLPKAGFSWEGDVYYWPAGPGCGKSHIIRKMATTDDLVLAPFVKLRPDYMGVGEAKEDLLFKTMHRAYETRGCAIVYVDEFTSVPFEHLIPILHLNGTKEVHLFGDVKQSRVLEPTEGMYIGNYIDLDALPKHEPLINFRNGEDVIALLNRKHGYAMRPRPGAPKRTIEVRPIDKSSAEGRTAMVFTHATAGALGMDLADKVTVRANQGQSVDKALLYITAQDARVANVAAMEIVGLSRHKESLIIASDGSDVSNAWLAQLDLDTLPGGSAEQPHEFPTDQACGSSPAETAVDTDSDAGTSISSAMREVLASDAGGSAWLTRATGFSDAADSAADLKASRLPEIPGSQEYADTTVTFVPVAFENHVPDVKPLEPELAEAKPAQVGFDSIRLMDSLLPRIALVDEVTSLNYVAGTVVQPAFADGVVAEEIVSPINQRGNLKDMASTYYSYATGSGLHYGAKKPMQELQVLQTRYLGVRDKRVFNHTSDELAKEIAALFVKECMQPMSAMDATEVTELFGEFLESANAKHYDKQFRGLGLAEVDTVRFHLKDIFKPKATGVTDLTKAGQGISAWDKDIQAMFGPAGRVLNVMFKKMLRPNVLYDNRENEQDFAQRLMSVMGDTPASARNGVSDAVAFDAGQNAFTQKIEQYIWSEMAISALYTAWYYRFRRSYRLFSEFVAGFVQYVKTSGEPMTLLNNSVLAAAIANYAIRGDGPFVLVLKGDDVFKRQLNLVIDQRRLDQVKAHSTLDLRFTVTEDVEFCGNVISGGLFVPSILRKLHKLAAHRFRDYKHFAEYQKSLRDFVARVAASPDWAAIVAANARQTRLTLQEVEAAFGVLQSAAHIDERTFFELFKKRVEPMPLRRADGQLHIDA